MGMVNMQSRLILLHVTQPPSTQTDVTSQQAGMKSKPHVGRFGTLRSQLFDPALRGSQTLENVGKNMC